MQAKLRHIAISVPDLEIAAKFYENAFGMKRLNKVETKDFGHGISLSDGVVNLTLLYFPDDRSAGDERGKDFVGIHHIGFMVDDVAAAKEAVVENGGRLRDADATIKDHEGFELKCRDPNGIVFDISRRWVGTQAS